jgi:hypothetical protein
MSYYKGQIMAEEGFYDSVGLLDEACRYKTSQEFLEVLYQEFNGIGNLLAAGVGPRLLTVSCALPKDFHGIDVNQGSLDRATEFMKSWESYRGIEPFKAEFDFIEQKGLDARFDNCHLYLTPDFPAELRGKFDGELASELFLHLSPPEMQQIIGGARDNLKTGGRFAFTLYPTGNPRSLDEQFRCLASGIGLNGNDFVNEGVVDIAKLASKIKEVDKNYYLANRNPFWLDLSCIRAYPESQVERICTDSGFRIRRKENIECGMFPFAYRLVYVLDKD